MEKLAQVAFRIPVSMLEQIDAFAAQMREDNPGLSASRTDAVRILLTRALADLEKTQPGTKPKRK